MGEREGQWREGIWIVAELDGHRAIVGKVANNGKDLNPSVKAKILGSKTIELSEKYDFFAPLRPVQINTPQGPAMGLTRDPVVAGNHFCFEACTSYLNMGLVTNLIFMEDMKKNDRRRYEEFLEHADDKIKEMRLAEAGLVPPTNGPPPPVKMPVGPGGVLDLSKLGNP